MMAAESKIEWTDATWNPVTGCSVVSPGCTNCYAMRLAGTRLQHHPSRAGLTKPSKAGPVWTGDVRFNEEWLTQPLRWKRPRMIFVCAHGDLFHESVPDEWIDRAFAVMPLAPQHTFQVPTKRAKRMREYCCDQRTPYRIARVVLDMAITKQISLSDHQEHWPVASEGDIDDPSDIVLRVWPLPNVWLGVSAERQQEADARIPDLLATPAAVRFVSCEPLLGPIDLTQICLLPKKPGSIRAGIHLNALAGNYCESGCAYTGEWDIDGPCPPDTERRSLDWVIVGGENGDRPMHPDWARSLRDQSVGAGVPFFFKQWGTWSHGSDFADDAATVFNNGDWLEAGHEPPVWLKERWNEHAPTLMRRVGKKRAGRLLDGREWNEMPEAARQ